MRAIVFCFALLVLGSTLSRAQIIYTSSPYGEVVPHGPYTQLDTGGADLTAVGSESFIGQSGNFVNLTSGITLNFTSSPPYFESNPDVPSFLNSEALESITLQTSVAGGNLGAINFDLSVYSLGGSTPALVYSENDFTFGAGPSSNYANGYITFNLNNPIAVAFDAPYQVQITPAGNAGGAYIGVQADNNGPGFAYNLTPEPSTWSMLLLGALMFGYSIFRRKKVEVVRNQRLSILAQLRCEG